MHEATFALRARSRRRDDLAVGAVSGGVRRRRWGDERNRWLGEAQPAAFYRQQEIGPGYGYLETRDGTTLAINVILPGPPEDGPYPTVIEYSGYDPANPDSPQPSTLLASALGYAAVGVNM